LTQATLNQGVKTINHARPLILRRVVDKNYPGSSGEVDMPINAPTPRPGARFRMRSNGDVEVNAANKPAIPSINSERPISPRVIDETYSDSSDDVSMMDATLNKGAKTINHERPITPSPSSKQCESTMQ
jgi:hypothetical protein